MSKAWGERRGDDGFIPSEKMGVFGVLMVLFCGGAVGSVNE